MENGCEMLLCNGSFQSQSIPPFYLFQYRCGYWTNCGGLCVLDPSSWPRTIALTLFRGITHPVPLRRFSTTLAQAAIARFVKSLTINRNNHSMKPNTAELFAEICAQAEAQAVLSTLDDLVNNSKLARSRSKRVAAWTRLQNLSAVHVNALSDTEYGPKVAKSKTRKPATPKPAPVAEPDANNT